MFSVLNCSWALGDSSDSRSKECLFLLSLKFDFINCVVLGLCVVGKKCKGLFIPFGDVFVCIMLSHVYFGADLSLKLLILTSYETLGKSLSAVL